MGGLIAEGSLGLDPMNDDAFDRNRNLEAKIGSLVEPLEWGKRGRRADVEVAEEVEGRRGKSTVKTGN